jgi:hypothetical protein
VSDFQQSALSILCSCEASLALSEPELSPKSVICNQLRFNLPGDRPVRKHDSGFNIAKLDGGFQYGGVMDLSLTLDSQVAGICFSLWCHLLSLVKDDDFWTPFRGQRLPLSMLL